MIAAFVVPEKKREYIDREEVLNALDRLCDMVCQYSKKQRSAMCGACTLGGAFDTIEELPTADVRPVVRGEWQSWTQDRPPCKWYSCDYCGFHALSKSNYCPNCGARMEGTE